MEVDKSKMIEEEGGDLTISKMIRVLTETMEKMGDLPLTFNIGTMDTMDSPNELLISDVGALKKDDKISCVIINFMPISMATNSPCKECGNAACEKHPTRLQ